MTWPNLARLLERHDTAAGSTEAGNVAILAVLLVLLLVGGFSTAMQWSVDGLQAPQVATAGE